MKHLTRNKIQLFEKMIKNKVSKLFLFYLENI